MLRCLSVIVCFAAAAHSQTPPIEQTLKHAIELHQAGNIAAAIPEYQAYLKQVPGNPIARSNLGAALAQAGRYTEAIAEYRKVLDAQPNNVPVRLNLALAYYKAAEISQAGEELTYDYWLYDGDDDAPCYCGSKSCRGSMYSPEELRKKRRAEAKKKKQAESAAKKNGNGRKVNAKGNGSRKA